MLELILGQVFGFFIIGSALHGIYTILHFQGRRLSARPFMKKAVHGLWAVCLLFFSVSYISSLSRTMQAGWSNSQFTGAIEVQAAQPTSSCLFFEEYDDTQCFEKPYHEKLLRTQRTQLFLSSECNRVAE